MRGQLAREVATEISKRLARYKSAGLRFKAVKWYHKAGRSKVDKPAITLAIIYIYIYIIIAE